jgi:serine phosphatase RsbU (regulator of sigma subunit)
MAALRFAIHAYAAQHDPPAAILNKLSYLLNVADSGQLATIMCALVNIERREITLTSAGHLPPLLISNGDSRYLETEVGLPIGVEAGGTYSSMTVSMPPGATLVAYTDGLVEHRGENLDDGLARLREVATRQDAPLPQLLRTLVDELRDGPAADDIAILGLRWAR